MRYVKGKLKLTSDNQWVFLYKYDHPSASTSLHGTRQVTLTPTDEEVVKYHAEELFISHNLEYKGEDIKAELTELWSTPEGGWSKLYPSEAFLPFSKKQTFAKLTYQEDESEHQETAP